jgi:hypothetical protein
MTQRLARDPVGQVIVFELMIRLFFYHVLGVRPELVGWERGAVRKAAEQWVSDGVAQDWPHVGMFGLVAAAFGPVEAQGADRYIRTSSCGYCRVPCRTSSPCFSVTATTSRTG